MRDARVVEVLANIDCKLDTKADFHEQANLEPVAAALKAAKVEAELEREEEHAAWNVESITIRPTPSARIGVDLAATARVPPHARHRRGRSPNTISRRSRCCKNGKRETQPGWRELLEHVKSEGTREVSIQRYKGLGEMNAEQLWDTTMNAETRTLLKVRLEDLAETEKIFSTLMGEDVESRRKFIEENALDVRNLDV